MKLYQYKSVIVPFLVGFLSCFFVSACASEDEVKTPEAETLERELDRIPSDATNGYILNKPLPKGRASLRVLAIGNSFTEDALSYVPELLSEAGYDENTYSIYYVVLSAASLQQWYEVVQSGQEIQITHKAGMRMIKEEGTMPELMAQEWDVITFQQYSEKAISYESFNPWLRYLIDCVKTYCPNPEVTLGWQMAWSYNDVVHQSMSNYQRWLLIAIATKKMMVNDGIDVILPIGTAIQNARNTPLNSEDQLTRDGWHLNDMGRYVASCTWLQALFGPVYGWTALKSNASSNAEEKVSNLSPNSALDEYRVIARSCAVNAVENPFNVVKYDSAK